MRRLLLLGLAIVALSLVRAGALDAQGLLANGQLVTGEINASAPVALYSFQGTAGDLVTLQAFGDAGGLQPALSLLGPSGTPLLTVSPPAAVTPAATHLDYRLAESGVYSVLLGAANGTQGAYALRLQSRPLPAAAATLPPSGQVDVLAAADAGPQYVMIPAEAVPAALTASSDTPDFLFRLVVRRSNGQVLADVNGLNPLALPLPPDEGGYEVAVGAMLPGTFGMVRLSLGGAPAASGPPAVNEPVATPEVGPGGACVIMATTGQINVRSGPGTNFSIIGSLASGQTLPVDGVNGGWYRVVFRGGQGWISGTVGRLGGDCASLPFAPEPGQPTVASTSSATATGTVTTTTTATATATATLPFGVTPTATLTPSATLSPTPTATLAPGITPTATATASATTPPTNTPTATPPPTNTPTPTPSFTATVPAPTAPPDANFNSPLNIPLGSTASVTDFVSYPDGDTTDRIRWDIIGMNPNSALPGGLANLTLSVSCFGTGTQNVQFAANGSPLACGQSITFSNLTFDTRTGQVTITAVAGANTYVQWVVTGTATQAN